MRSTYYPRVRMYSVNHSKPHPWDQNRPGQFTPGGFRSWEVLYVQQHREQDLNIIHNTYIKFKEASLNLPSKFH